MHPSPYRTDKWKKPTLRADKYVRAIRTCLGCGKNFDSSWIGNRLCGVCRLAEGVADPQIGAPQAAKAAEPPRPAREKLPVRPRLKVRESV